MSILGTDGYLWYDGKLHLREADADGEEEIELPKNQALRDDSHSFIAQIALGMPPLRTREDGRRTMEISLDCTRSVETGEKIVYS